MRGIYGKQSLTQSYWGIRELDYEAAQKMLNKASAPVEDEMKKPKAMKGSCDTLVDHVDDDKDEVADLEVAFPARHQPLVTASSEQLMTAPNFNLCE